MNIIVIGLRTTKVLIRKSHYRAFEIIISGRDVQEIGARRAA